MKFPVKPRHGDGVHVNEGLMPSDAETQEELKKSKRERGELDSKSEETEKHLQETRADLHQALEQVVYRMHVTMLSISSTTCSPRICNAQLWHRMILMLKCFS